MNEIDRPAEDTRTNKIMHEEARHKTRALR